jgi:hypothetical protein
MFLLSYRQLNKMAMKGNSTRIEAKREGGWCKPLLKNSGTHPGAANRWKHIPKGCRDPYDKGKALSMTL